MDRDVVAPEDIQRLLAQLERVARDRKTAAPERYRAERAQRLVAGRGGGAGDGAHDRDAPPAQRIAGLFPFGHDDERAVRECAELL